MIYITIPIPKTKIMLLRVIAKNPKEQNLNNTLFFFPLFMATPRAYGSFQARG